MRMRTWSTSVATLIAVASTLTACSSAQGTSSAQTSAAPAPASSETQAAQAAALTVPAGIPGPACGTAAAATLARTAGMAAGRIYAGELASAEVFSDRRQVETYEPLLRALAEGNRVAVGEAVTSLVFSHTHVVRLRVSSGGRVLADVGGPLILAPVSGTLRRGGRTLGHYVLSVQDDLGYVKLETRFIGVPVLLREGSHTLPVAGALSSAPARIPDVGPVTLFGAPHEAFSFAATAFPSGALRISLLVPVPASLARASCAGIRVAELGDIARHVASRFTLSQSDFASFIKATEPLTGGLLYIRKGSRQLAGSDRGPRSIPDHGVVSYRGATYGVFSFTAPTPAGSVRIFQLVSL